LHIQCQTVFTENIQNAGVEVNQMKQQERGRGRNKKPMTGGSAGYTIPQAGAMVGLSRNGSYDAAIRGQIPTVELGRKKIVPRAIWDRKLGIGQG
jgi:hypothetical protein